MSPKIWRYIDMTKFISLLVNEALYFACPNEFEDPFECHIPRHHLEAIYKAGFPQIKVDQDNREELSVIAKVIKNTASKFGVSCWYKSKYQSDAMWKLYSASIAIESSVEHLKNSIRDQETRENLKIGSVQYLDFEKAPFRERYKEQGLFMKRTAFAHEKELRAVIYLPKTKNGNLVKCCLNTLITRIHLSPLSKSFIKADVEALLRKFNIHKPVIQSDLLQEPVY